MFTNRFRNMNLRVLSVIFILLFSFLNVAATVPSKEIRIRFKKGATKTVVTGRLKGINDEVVFVLRARAGQHMRVNIKGKGATRGVVIFPSGQQDGGPGGLIFDGEITENGDYRIRVTESSMAEAWRGTFTLKVEIV